jgi:hypothetical protein
LEGGIRHRSVLNAGQVREIYRLNYLASNTASTPNLLGLEVSNSVLLAAQYGVSPKTIRDIWNRKTWAHTTADIFEIEKSQTINRSNLDYLNLKVCPQFNVSAHAKNCEIGTYHFSKNQTFAVSTVQSWAPQRIAR